MPPAFLLKPRKQWPSRYSPGRPGIISPAIFLRPPAPRAPRFSARSPMSSRSMLCTALACLLALLCGCGPRPTANTATVLIENSPNSLDPRIGTDAVAERIDPLIFDSLVQRNDHFGLDPDLAVRWEVPNPTTYIFHLRTG